MKDNKKLKRLGNRLEQILGFSNYCNMTCKQKGKTKINKEKTVKSNIKIKYNKTMNAMGSRLEWILGSSNYFKKA